MKYKVGDKVRVRIDLVPSKMYGNLTFLSGNMSKCAGQICTIMEVLDDKKYYVNENPFAWSEEMLEPADSKILRMADGTIIGEFKGIPVYATGGMVSIHDLPTSEWYNPMRLTFKNGSSIEAIPNEDAIRSKEPELVWIDKIALPTATETKEMVERVRREILKFTNAFPKEDKKMPTKFTFYVKEGTRVDKTCNKLIPTMTTFITAESYGDSTYHGAATCDKADYNERQGCLEALANAMLGGNFDRDFNRAVKANELADKKKRTCTYCGKVFDTVEEKQAEEAWHVERKKARRERYLLRKRAKEIAFEEQAQKMAKEMMGEQK